LLAVACAANALLTASVVPVYAADAFSTDWETAAKSRARLVAADARLAGFEIRLAPGAITYWRNPGDSGLPPTFDFAGSDNIDNVEPIFPAPTRIREADGGEAFGYDGEVVFPLRVKPRDPAKPTTLALRASYAVCEKVCLPAEARLTLKLPDASSPYADLVGSALAAAPRQISPKDFGELKSDGASGWRLCAPREAGPERDLFVDPPEGWWITVAHTKSEPGQECFRLTLRDKPREAAFPVALRLTTGGPSPAETTIEAPEPR
jgi:DsbC/DsbD-like thiol-disulfide interchange protein